MAVTEQDQVGATELVLERQLSAAPERVWRAWTDPAELARWFGPEHLRRVEVDADVQVGGRFRFLMHADAPTPHDVSGTYREVVPPHRLVFTWAWASTPADESLVTIELEPAASGTLLRITHSRLSTAESVTAHAEGWRSSFVKLATHIGN